MYDTYAVRPSDGSWLIVTVEPGSGEAAVRKALGADVSADIVKIPREYPGGIFNVTAALDAAKRSG